ncbi:MAG: TetR/AcrR family transcriptional regulator C-terminal domain-containing protein [Clostridia bacterium]|nr:TetR/AcrR family transcriptional regulator C-terminal domain-containing protein [Clostridia bacterium]
MADSNITKKALSASLKALMTKMPYTKISVGDICDGCEMNRKSFYYHFKDKQDLINWIFDTELSERAENARSADLLRDMETLFEYLYDNKAFYKKAFGIEGQNSLSEHFRDILRPAFRNLLQGAMNTENVSDFQIDFLTDGILCAIKRWLSAADCVPPHELSAQLRACILTTATHVCGNIDL